MELPPFTVLTGLNGAGKTHFMEAIANNTFESEGLSTRNPSTRVLFSWSEIRPKTEVPKIRRQLRKSTTGSGLATSNDKKLLCTVCENGWLRLECHISAIRPWTRSFVMICTH